jgi:hypothetical protein
MTAEENKEKKESQDVEETPVQDKASHQSESTHDIGENSEQVVQAKEETLLSDNMKEQPSSEMQSDEDEDEDQHNSELDDQPSAQQRDYSVMDMSALLNAARESLNHPPRETIRAIESIRPYFDDLLRKEKKDALQDFLDKGGSADEFVFEKDELRDQLNKIFHTAQEARAEERRRIEEEKQENLKRKQHIIGRLKEITDTDETEKSIEEVKSLQKEWKEIRAIPREHAQELWDSFTFLLDKFYDNHSINIDLKNLDRQKNLDHKIDIIKKMTELEGENNLKTAFILLNKYKEEFHNTGPVPREYNEDIWNRFRATYDSLLNSKKEEYDKLLKVRQMNAEKKQLLVEKAELIAEKPYKSPKDWKNATNELETLMEQWKAIGPVPRSKNESIWRDFRKSFNAFYNNKGDFYKERKKEQKANLILKEDLCKQAELIAETRTDWVVATKEIIALQEEWKKVGSVPEKVSNAIWKRFREANDSFFNKKREDFKDKIEEEENNLKLKEELVAKIESLLEGEKQQNGFEQLRELQKEWSAIGHVPFKKKDGINKRYNKATDKLYEIYKKDRSELKAGQMQDHYQSLLGMPNGLSKLKDEERKLSKKIGFLKSEIDTWNNNIEFFSGSKNAEKLRKDVEGKIEKTNGQIQRLLSELRVLRSVMKENQ